MTDTQLFWKKCSACKKPISFKALYYVCNVSTCNRQRTGLSFCSVSCWDSHGPMMRHRESWAEERRAPSHEQWAEQLEADAAPKTRTPREKPAAATSTPMPAASPAAAPVRAILRKKA